MQAPDIHQYIHCMPVSIDELFRAYLQFYGQKYSFLAILNGQKGESFLFLMAMKID